MTKSEKALALHESLRDFESAEYARRKEYDKEYEVLRRHYAKAHHEATKDGLDGAKYCHSKHHHNLNGIYSNCRDCGAREVSAANSSVVWSDPQTGRLYSLPSGKEILGGAK